MKKNQAKYTATHAFSSFFMILALVWLTVSTPFVYAGQQAKKECCQKHTGQTQNDTNPFSNTTEEKNESGVNTLSEYLHDPHDMETVSLILVTYYKCHPSDIYINYHPEEDSPPPKA